MEISLFRKEIVPFILLFCLLIVMTIITDFLLHLFNMVWIGRYLGIPGTAILLLSFLYSLKKRKYIKFGKPKILLGMHEIMAWTGSLMILVHAGIHFYAVLPWLATFAMLICVCSGLTGKYLLKNSTRMLSAKKEKLKSSGLSEESVEREIFWDAIALDLMKRWRTVHLPLTSLFCILSLAHIFSIILFWL